MLRRLLLLPAVLALAAGACSTQDGRSLPPPRPDQTTTTSTEPPTLDGDSTGQGAVEVFSLLSEAIPGGGEIPAEHTCDGADTSPPLAWASTPPAAELALIVRDPDADGFVHWLVTGIDPLVQGVAAGGVPEGATEHDNDFDVAGWRGPCPPEGEAHTYELALYALPEPLPASDPTLTSDALVAQIEGSASAVAVLTGTYER